MCCEFLLRFSWSRLRLLAARPAPPPPTQSGGAAGVCVLLQPAVSIAPGQPFLKWGGYTHIVERRCIPSSLEGCQLSLLMLFWCRVGKPPCERTKWCSTQNISFECKTVDAWRLEGAVALCSFSIEMDSQDTLSNHLYKFITVQNLHSYVNASALHFWWKQFIQVRIDLTEIDSKCIERMSYGDYLNAWFITAETHFCADRSGVLPQRVKYEEGLGGYTSCGVTSPGKLLIHQKNVSAWLKDSPWHPVLHNVYTSPLLLICRLF